MSFDLRVYRPDVCDAEALAVLIEAKVSSPTKRVMLPRDVATIAARVIRAAVQMEIVLGAVESAHGATKTTTDAREAFISALEKPASLPASPSKTKSRNF